MARYMMTIVFDVHEKVQMKYVLRARVDGDQAMEGIEYESVEKTQPHINKLYEDVIERIERSLKHPITYDIISFEKL